MRYGGLLMSPSKVKHTKMPASEIQFIKNNRNTMTPAEMAARLERSETSVLKILNEQEENTSVELNIKRTYEWKALSAQLSKEEQELFIYHWKTILGTQFKSDITHTERLQVIDVIRVEILINRTLKRMYDSQIQTEELQTELKLELDKDLQFRDANKILGLRTSIADAFLAISNLQKENKDLLDKKNNLIRELKASRSQRVSKIEDGKTTLKDWVVTLIQNPDLRRDIGVEIEKFRIAAHVEFDRLSELYEYADKSLSQPVMNSDNVLDD